MSKKQKECFVISQIGKENSEERRQADCFLEWIVKPTAGEIHKYKIVRADDIGKPGIITSQIITKLFEADLVIADLTNLNANVFYELGLRHLLQKPDIHMVTEGQSIPFDVANYRAIIYGINHPKTVEKAKKELSLQIKEIEKEGFVVENPVTIAKGKQEISVQGTPFEKQVLEQITELTEKVRNLENEAERNIHHSNFLAHLSENAERNRMELLRQGINIYPANPLFGFGRPTAGTAIDFLSTETPKPSGGGLLSKILLEGENPDSKIKEDEHGSKKAK
ncbi:MAG: hypothetical protein IH901_01555 [Proteobacteria bacterium]|nr:hypothetical protein [Pseudomonadota bacterium]